MEEVHPTRSELLARKNQLALAEQGRGLLKEKLDVLLKEFMDVMDRAVSASERLRAASSRSGRALNTAKAVDGTVAVRSAAMAAKGDTSVEMEGGYVMGVPIPEIAPKKVTRSPVTRGYSPIGVSGRIDETAYLFEEQLEAIIEVAAVETKLKRLGAEIQRTRRRVNALDYVVLPRLDKQIRYIRMTLEERSREDLFRLKKVKKALEAKKKQA